MLRLVEHEIFISLQLFPYFVYASSEVLSKERAYSDILYLQEY